MPLDFLDDSPAFRKRLGAVEERIKDIQNWMERCAGGARRSVHYGQKYADACVGYANEMLDIPTWHQEDQHVTNSYDAERSSHLVPAAGFGPALVKLGAAMKHVQELSRDSLVVMERSIGGLPRATDDERIRIKECRRKFAESDLEWAAAVKRAHSVRKESTEESSAADLSFVDAKLAFECSRFELVAALNEIEANKQIELFDAVRTSVTAMTQFYEQSVGHMRELAAHMDALAPLIAERRDEQLAERARNHATVTHLKRLREDHRRGVRPSTSEAGGSAAETCTAVELIDTSVLSKEGYLYKKSSSKAVPAKLPTGTSSWKRLWFRLEDGVLYYHKKSRGAGDDGVRAINLLICTVNVSTKETGKRFCFDLVSPYRSYTLQAESATSLQSWVDSLRASIEHNFYALGRSDLQQPYPVSDGSDEFATTATGPTSSSAGPLAAFSSMPGNHQCADCGEAASPPDWVVMPYGCLVCIECSGIHRSLGVHISKVRSLSLDTWTPEMANAASALGNTVANAVMLAALPHATAAAASPPSAVSSRADKEAWIRLKYQRKGGIERSVASDQLPTALCDAARRDNLSDLLALVVQADAPGGELDRPVQITGDAPVHSAAAADAPRALELLLLAGAGLDVTDALARTPAHVAAAAGAERCLSLLMRRAADMSATDASGSTPLDLAKQGDHAGCVGILDGSLDGSDERARHRDSFRDDISIDLAGSTRDSRTSRSSSFSLQAGGPTAAPAATERLGSFPPGGARHARNGSGSSISVSVIDSLVSSLDGLSTVPTPGSAAYTSPAEDPAHTVGGVTGAPSSGRRGLRIGSLKPRKLMSLAMGTRFDRTPRRDLGELSISDDEFRAPAPPADYIPASGERPATGPANTSGAAGRHRRSQTWGGGGRE